MSVAGAEKAVQSEPRHALHRNLFGKCTNGREPVKALLARHPVDFVTTQGWEQR
jgi:hypothetical protein